VCSSDLEAQLAAKRSNLSGVRSRDRARGALGIVPVPLQLHYAATELVREHRALVDVYGGRRRGRAPIDDAHRLRCALRRSLLPHCSSRGCALLLAV
jgi:hypothetical protein